MMGRAVAALIAAFGGSSAHAELISEAKFGVTDHNICITDCKNANKEKSPNVSIELAFQPIEQLGFIGKPRPYVTASWNVGGDTSFAGAGLEWSLPVTDRFSIEPGFGYVLHNGELESPFPQGSRQSQAFAEQNLLLGSEDLFRTSVGLSYKMTEHWGAQIIYEHLSHGQIIGSGRNQGLDNIGVRLTYRPQK